MNRSESHWKQFCKIISSVWDNREIIGGYSDIKGINRQERSRVVHTKTTSVHFFVHCALSGTTQLAKSSGRQSTSWQWLPQWQPFRSRLFLAVNSSSVSPLCSSQGTHSSCQGSQAQEGFCGLWKVAISLVVSIKLAVMMRGWARSEHPLWWSQNLKNNRVLSLFPSLIPRKLPVLSDLKQAKRTTSWYSTRLKREPATEEWDVRVGMSSK